MTIYLTTVPRSDLADADMLRSDAAVASFRAAWERAAAHIGRAAGVTVEAYTGPDAAHAHDLQRRSRAALVSLGMDDEAAAVLLSDFWQAAHDAVHENRRGRWACDLAACRRYGEALRRRLATVSA